METRGTGTGTRLQFLLFVFAFALGLTQSNMSTFAANGKEILIKSTTDKSGKLDDKGELSGVGPIEANIIASGMQSLKEALPELAIELRYSTENNFMELDIYGELTKAYAHPALINKLEIALKDLQERRPGYTFKVYDAVRPRACQAILWNSLDKPESEKSKYVTNPKVGSHHNYGMAIDLTIINEKGEELDMGTPYDFFGELAYPRSEYKMFNQGKLTGRQYANRLLLRDIMTDADFLTITTEWWHFNVTDRAHLADFAIVE